MELTERDKLIIEMAVGYQISLRIEANDPGLMKDMRDLLERIRQSMLDENRDRVTD